MQKLSTAILKIWKLLESSGQAGGGEKNRWKMQIFRPKPRDPNLDCLGWGLGVCIFPWFLGQHWSREGWRGSFKDLVRKLRGGLHLKTQAADPQCIYSVRVSRRVCVVDWMFLSPQNSYPVLAVTIYHPDNLTTSSLSLYCLLLSQLPYFNPASTLAPARYLRYKNLNIHPHFENSPRLWSKL